MEPCDWSGFVVGFGTLPGQQADPTRAVGKRAAATHMLDTSTFCALRGETTLYRARHQFSSTVRRQRVRARRQSSYPLGGAE